MQADFSIEVLTGEAEIQRKCFAIAVGIFIGFAIAERIGYPRPNDGAIGFGYQAWRTELVCVNSLFYPLRLINHDDVYQ